MKKYVFPIFCMFLILTTALHSQSISRGYYLDVPTANFAEGLYLNLDGSYPLGSDTSNYDVNAGIEVNYGKFNLSLKWYNEADFVASTSYQILSGDDGAPALSIGMDNITYRTEISPIGHDSVTFEDEDYVERPQEVASLYLVGTKKFNQYFEATLGIGRGRFVGYGPRSRLLNYDVFFDEAHKEFAFGFFGGLKFSTPGGPSFIVETDGRDANAGIQYEKERYKVVLGLNKFEQFTSPESQPPRLYLGFSFKTTSLEKPALGILNVTLLNEGNGAPINGRIVYSKDGERNVVVVPESGEKKVSLKPGIYMLGFSSDGFNSKKGRVKIEPAEEMNLNIQLSERLTANQKSSMRMVKKASEHFRKGELKKAKSQIESALKLYPDNEKAKAGMEEIESAISDTVSVLRRKAESLESSNIQAAISMWQRVLSWREDEGVEVKIRQLKNRLRSIRQARTREQEEEQLSESEIQSLYRRGVKAYVKGDYSTAAYYFRKVLSADPGHSNAKKYLKKAKEKM